MGIFDKLFGKNEQPKSQSRGFDQPLSNNGSNPVAIFYPKSYEDVEKIIDTLRSGKNAIVHFTELKETTSMRIIDMLSGAIYALNGGLYEMEKNIYMFSPSGVIVNN
jgi:cell division inhibitor SepF